LLTGGWPKSYIPQHKFDEVAERIPQHHLELDHQPADVWIAGEGLNGMKSSRRHEAPQVGLLVDVTSWAVVPTKLPTRTAFARL
jgi:hypothetical protein